MSSSSAPPIPPSPFNLQSSIEKIFMHIDYNVTCSNGIVLEIKKSTLMDYASTVPKIVSLIVPGEPNLEELNSLSDEIKKLIIALLQIFKDLFDNGLCLQSLTANDIVVLLDCHSTPKLKQNVTFVQANENMINLNMLWLGQILNNTIFCKCEMPMDAIDFLDLFMTNGCANKDLIFVHSVIVDLDDQNDYFCTVHDFLLKILKKLPQNPSDYNDILNELIFPENWDPDVKSNPHLKDCYEGRDMRNGRKKKKDKSVAASTGGGSGQSSRAGSGVLEIGQPGNGVSVGAATGVVKSSSLSKSNGRKYVGGGSGQSSRAGRGVLEIGQPGNGVSVGAATGVVKDSSLSKSNGRKDVAASTGGGSGQSSRAGSGVLQIGQPANGVSVGAATRVVKSSSLSKSNGHAINKGMLMKQQRATQGISKKTPSQATQWVPKKVQPSKVQAPELTHAAISPTAKSIPAEVSPSGCAAEKAQPKLTHTTASPTTPSGCIAESSSTKKTYNMPGSNPKKEVLKFYRNSVQHGIDYAIKNGRLLYGPRGLAIMLLFRFPQLLSSALKALHKRGYLSSMENLPKLLR